MVYAKTLRKSKIWFLVSLCVVLALFCFLLSISSAFNGRIEQVNSSIEWQKYILEQGKFSIKMPGQPIKKVITVNNPELGPLDANLFYYNAKQNIDGNLYYSVSYTKFPLKDFNLKNKDFINHRFDESRDGAVSNTHGKLIEERVIKLGKFPGRYWRIDIKNGKYIINAKAYFVYDMLYLIQVITESKKDFNKTIYKFLDSFEPLNK